MEDNTKVKNNAGTTIANPSGDVLANTPSRRNTVASSDNKEESRSIGAAGTPGSVVTAAPSSVVSSSRKEELLMEARSNRLEWIHRVPFPFREDDDNNDDGDRAAGGGGAAATNKYINKYDLGSRSNLWNENEQLKHFISSNYASSKMSSMTRVLSYLYGMYENNPDDVDVTPDQLAERIQTLLGQIEDNKSHESKMSHNNVKMMMLHSSQQDDGDNKNDNYDHQKKMESTKRATKYYDTNELRKQNIDKEVFQSYRDFWNKLQTPECALLVQGMRNFLRNVNQKYKTNNNNDNDNDEMVEAIANTFKSYSDSTFESLKSHVAWKKTNIDANVKRSLQSFLYGQCHPLLFQPTTEGGGLLWTKQAREEDQQWRKRLSLLQFITPKHLEIACLDNLDDDNETEQSRDETQSTTANDGIVNQILKEPMETILSINKYYSPLEKLYRILALFQAVNAALSAALNDHYKKNNNKEDVKDKTNSSNKKTKLPSADDILPTIILTVIRAKPKRLLADLRMIEAFVPVEYLRGEAGYAYTNVYGAVQFLKDLDMNDPPKSLFISNEDFQKGLLLQQQRQQQQQQQQQQSEQTTSLSTMENSGTVSLQHVPSVQDIRDARLRGDIVDLQWAIRYQQDKQQEILQQQQQQQQQGQQNSEEDEIARIIREHQQQPTSAAGESSGQGEQQKQKQQQQYQSTDTAASSLLSPLDLSGFSRQYSFLTSNPEDIRLSDLPQLLSEYKMLVHTTEMLLSERATIVSNEKKKRYQSIQDQLMYTALQDLKDDPSLLATAVNGAVNDTTNDSRNVTPKNNKSDDDDRKAEF